MRTLTTDQEAVYGSPARSTHVKVSIKVGATWHDMTDLEGHDFLISAEVSDDIDSPTMTAKVSLMRAIDELSLSPLMTGSKLNNLGGSFDPIINSQNEIKVETAVMPFGVSPISADWQNIFEGRIDNPDIRKVITLNCRDMGGRLMDTFIETQRTYSDSGGTAVETVMQSILTDNSTGITLYTPTSPSWQIKGYIQQKEPVLAAIRRLAHQIGWQLKYRWDSGTSAWRLTFYEPDRAKSTPDYTFDSNDQWIFDKDPKLSISNVRNVVRVIYTDELGQSPATIEQSDAGSIAAYGRRFMEIQEDSSSNIDTSGEATDMADSILSDLKDPVLNLQATTGMLWFAETGDLYRFPADYIVYDTDQDLAVKGWTHSFIKGGGKTTLKLQGRVLGLYKNWLSKGTGPGTSKGYDALGSIEKWRTTRHTMREGIASFHKNVNSVRRGMLDNHDFGYQSRVIAGSGWEPDSWFVTTGTWGASGDVYVDDTINLTGARSLLYTSDAGATAKVETDFIPVTETDAYGTTLVARTDSTTGTNHIAVYLDWYDDSKTFISSTSTLVHTFASTGTWERTTMGVNNSVSTARYVKVRLDLTHATTQKIWVDSVYFKVLNDQTYVYQGTGTSIADQTWTSLTYDSQLYAFYSGGSSANIRKARIGTYHFIAGMELTGLTLGGAVRMRIQGSANGSTGWATVAEVEVGANSQLSSHAQCSYISTADDTNAYFRVQVWHDYGSNRTTSTGQTETYFCATQTEYY